MNERSESAGLAEGSFHGGDVFLCDDPLPKRRRLRRLQAGLGDAILFCTSDRLVAIGGAYGLQPVKHGVTDMLAGERYVLGVPFHGYRSL